MATTKKSKSRAPARTRSARLSITGRVARLEKRLELLAASAPLEPARAFERKFKEPPPAIGDKWHGGVYAGLARGENGAPDYHLVALPLDDALKGKWGTNERVAGALSEFDGLANTKAMAAAGSALAKKVLERADGAYIAAKREARIAYTNVPELYPDSGWAWTSTQNRDDSDWAWFQYFSDWASHFSSSATSRTSTALSSSAECRFDHSTIQ